MCGITGVFSFRDPSRIPDRAVLTAMTRSLAHRGPDGEGIWVRPGIGFGHRRLAILDCSERAHQPMIDSEARLAIVYNGEIYNFRELRKQLVARGHVFRSSGDTEVVLHSYREWGVSVVDRISGIYAFAIWDEADRSLFLARDALGVKPLFFSELNGVLRFGSEIKAILTDPEVGREPDDEALDAFFTFGYTPAPLTGFRNVRQLPPGHCMLVTETGSRSWRFWRTPYEERPADLDFASAVTRFGELLDRVTRAQMVSDVPLGAFLSGGLDSAAVVRSMTRAGKGPVRALCVGFPLRSYDERATARLTAHSLGVDLDEQEVDLDNTSLVPTISRHLEEPTADSSALPVYLLCRETRRRFTVAMSGDGADELLAGYETYRATALARRYRRLPEALRRGVVKPVVQCLPVSDRKYGLREVANRFVEGADLGAGRDHCAWRRLFGAEVKDRLYRRGFRLKVAGCDPLGRYAAHIDAVPAGREPLAGLLNADTEFFLANDMLVKVDRMSMAHGLEVRVPFLDVEMVRFCANLPGEYKLHRGRVRKHVLRESLRRSIPDRVLRRPKSGFNIPVGAWMRAELGDLLADSVATRRPEIEPYLDLGALERVTAEHRARRADHGHVLFAVLMFALWLDNVARAWRFSTPPVSAAALREPVLGTAGKAEW